MRLEDPRDGSRKQAEILVGYATEGQEAQKDSRGNNSRGKTLVPPVWLSFDVPPSSCS